LKKKKKVQDQAQNLDPNLQTLLGIDLLKLLNLTDKEDSEKQEFLQKFIMLSWVYFFETDGKDVPEEELKRLQELADQKKFDEVQSYLEENFPNLRVAMIKNSLLAKKTIIEEEIEAIVKKTEDPKEKEKYENMLKTAQANQWQEFIYYLNKE